MTEQPAVVVTENDIDMIVRHTFLQTIMKRSCVTEAEAQSILESFGEAAVGRGRSCACPMAPDHVCSF